VKRFYLIDGYNVIFRDPDLREIYRKDPEAGRRRLLDLVSRYAAARSARGIVAFDGGESPEGRVEPSSSGSVETIFVKDADAYIRRRVYGAREKDALVVVSSDEAHVARYARGMGIRLVRVEEFMEDVRVKDRMPRGRSEKPESETEDGVDYWLEAFGSGQGKRKKGG